VGKKWRYLETGEKDEVGMESEEGNWAKIMGES